MTFASEIAKPRSERFPLVRLTPRRDVSTLLASEGSGIYGMTFTYDIAKIERNGVELTKDSSAPTVNDHWYVDSAGELDVKLAAAPSATNAIIVFYNLYFTTGEYRTAYKTPTDSATGEVAYAPRITSDPKAVKSVEDALGGVLSSSLSSISLDNSDNFMEVYFGQYDSWLYADVAVWVSVNGQVAELATGFAIVPTLGDTVNITVSDVLSKLNQPALMGDTYDDAHFNLTDYPDVYPADAGKPIPMQMAQWLAPALNEVYDTTAQRYTLISPSLAIKATCVSYDDTASGTVNRSWVTARIPEGMALDTSTKTLGTITYVADANASGTGAWHVVRVQSTGGNLVSGMQVYLYDSAWMGGGYRYGRVLSNAEHDFDDGGGVKTYQYLIYAAWHTGDSLFTTTMDTTVGDIVTVYAVIKSDTTVNGYLKGYPMLGPIRATPVTLSSGNTVHKLTLLNSMELSPDRDYYMPTYGGSYITPDTHDIYVAYYLQGNSEAVDYADEVYNRATGGNITGSLGTAHVCMTIPNVGETTIGTYRSYLEKIIKSVGGYLYQSAGNDAIAGLLDTPTSGTIISEDNATNIKVSVEYQDVSDEVQFSNPHLSSDKRSGSEQTKMYMDTDGGHTVTVLTDGAQYLHKSKKIKEISHVMQEIDHRSTELAALYSHRRAIYSFDTATALLNANIGDSITLNSSKVLGESGTVDLVIISIETSASGVSIRACDLLGV